MCIRDRYFAPWNGISEDPVNGSSHTILAPYWAGRLSKQQLVARQCSERGGVLHLEIVGDRVKIKGEATLVVEGAMLVPGKWLTQGDETLSLIHISEPTRPY
eukprot:TRINITY_DN31026_c0_g1_i1.p2 TRINITY_DN31026_c0_g1~~TRINITY_DN31026_c0_g1_i1.p2  ORF type:complete len:102 (-),score=43.06 TRINITY_DN31026_c0_g1_i1:86-391(-)